MLKLDTQGTELEILKGGEDCLRTTCLVEVEVEFLHIYKGQALFEDVLAFMRSHGFDLLYLNRVFKQRKGYRGWSKGQIIFGDALFGRREDSLDSLNAESVGRYLLLLVNYGFLDIAHNILTTIKLPSEMEDAFTEYLEHQIDIWPIKSLKRFAIPLVDKFILLLLHARRHNSMPIDSDRSWPFR